jgi:ABC-type antimicrobial peptide transport system permease subunit
MQIGDDSWTDTSPEADNPKVTIVGVVKNLRQNLYDSPLPEFDYSVSQLPAKDSFLAARNMHLVVRTSVVPDGIVPGLQRAFHNTDPTLPFRTPETMRTIMADVLIFERLENWLFGAFAASAMLLAVVGIYGLISHEVELSTRDIGVRLALGATRERILAGIYRRVGWMLGGGIAIGLLVTAAAKKYIGSVVALHLDKDAVPILTLTSALLAAGLLAALFPARRASSIEPVEALRDE